MPPGVMMAVCICACMRLCMRVCMCGVSLVVVAAECGRFPT